MTDLSFEQVATQYYAMLYRFALSLTQQDTEALDLVQQTFYLWTTKGHQLRDSSKIKSWLFTTLYREHLRWRRREKRFPQVELEVLEYEPTHAPAANLEQMDADVVMQALLKVDEVFRTPLTLFYLEDLSYKEIAEMLGVPSGTVMSRLSRGKEQIRRMLASEVPSGERPKATKTAPGSGLAP